jgi:hypothetical protein
MPAPAARPTSTFTFTSAFAATCLLGDGRDTNRTMRRP